MPCQLTLHLKIEHFNLKEDHFIKLIFFNFFFWIKDLKEWQEEEEEEATRAKVSFQSSYI